MAPIPRILVVEDDEIISNLITTMLEKKGYHVVSSVVSGEEAILKSAELEPDLVIMDINLCGFLDGVAAARYIFQFFHYPIIFLTALCDDSILERAKSSQPYGFLLKPFTYNELTSNAQLALYNHSMRQFKSEKYLFGDPKKITSALESVIVTDTKGRIIYFNPYTVRLFEIPEKQILMNQFKNVVQLFNTKINEPIEDPIPQVLNQMIVIVNEFYTEIVTKSGAHRMAAVTARPLKDDHNELLGVFIHIREKTLDQIKMSKRA